MISLSGFGKTNNRKKKRIGRGSGSGHGQTSGKGNKGQNARAGGGVRRGFEGGQMPYARRVPKRGFNNPLKESYAIINIKNISILDVEKINLNVLKLKGIIKNNEKKIKILGEGKIDKKIVVACNKISKSARSKIKNAGGTVEII
jgi:large subunit ribosomal protein L15